MVQIQTIGIKRNITSFDFTYKMYFLLPAIYGTGSAPKVGLSIILESYPDGFNSEIIVPEGTVITFSETIGVLNSATLVQIKNQLQNKYTQIRTKLDSLTLTPYDTIAGLSFDGTTWA